MTRTFPALHLLPLPLLAALALLPGNTAHAQTAAPPMKVTTRTCGAYTVRLAQNGFDDPPDRAAVLQGVGCGTQQGQRVLKERDFFQLGMDVAIDGDAQFGLPVQHGSTHIV